MFRLRVLTMIGYGGNRYPYEFSSGINYIYGANGTGKSEFYEFLDFMLGASRSSPAPLSEREWYKNTLHSAELLIAHNGSEYAFVRSIDGLSFRINKDGHSLPCQSLSDYCEIVNSLLGVPLDALKALELYTGEKLKYRSMTIFNFLGEKGAGKLDDFLDKSSDLKYGIKVARILDFIFNDHVREIVDLENKAEELRIQRDTMTERLRTSEFIVGLINDKLSVLRSPFEFSGRNIAALRKAIEDCRGGIYKKGRIENVEGLRFAAESMANKVSILAAEVEDMKSTAKLQQNREKLLKALVSIAEGQSDYEQCVRAAIRMVGEIQEGASYSRLDLKRKALKKARAELKKLNSHVSALELGDGPTDVEQRRVALSVLDDAVERFEYVESDDLAQIVKELQETQKAIARLKAGDDEKKLRVVSESVTAYYGACKEFAPLAAEDFDKQGYEIDFLKKGCSLRPSKYEEGDDYECRRVTYIAGSFARHALIQLCGYAALLEFLFASAELPVLPLLCVDHPSKPFDGDNIKGVGAILKRFVDRNSEAQVFVFDSANPVDLGIEPTMFIDLTRTPGGGFNPFYRS